MPTWKSIRRFAVFLAAVCSMQFCTGCSIPFLEKQESDGSGYLFTASLSANPKSLDPQSATDAASKTIIENLYEGLVELDSSGVPQLAAAESCTTSPDGLTYTFLLKSDRFWFYDANQDDVVDDGETWQVTASDYVYAFRRIFDPQTQSSYTDTFSCLKNADAVQSGQMDPSEIGVRAVSDTELQFSLSRPDAEFLTNLASTAAMPCNEAFFQQTKGRYGLDQESVASCGAFYLRLWFYDPYGNQNQIFMRRNATNAKARSVYPTNLTFQIRKSSDAAAADFADGTSDLMISSVYQPQYMESDNWNITASRATTLGLIFNPDDTAFSNSKIRQALSMGIDRANTGKDSGDDLVPAYGLIPPGIHWDGNSYRDTYPDAQTAYDADTAAALFQEGMQELGKESLDSAKILVCSSLMDCDHLHDIIQNWQKVFGFYIGIEEVSESDYWKRLENKNYTIAVYGITSSYDSPAGVLEQFDSHINQFHYANGTTDASIQALHQCGSKEELQQKCAQLEQRLLSEYLFLPVFYKNQYCITKSSNRDIGYDPFSGALNFRDAKHFE